MKHFCSIAGVFLILLLISSCDGGDDKVVSLKDAIPPGEALKDGFKLSEKSSHSYAVKVANGEETPGPEMVGKYELLYGPERGGTTLTVVVRYSATVKEAKAEFASIKEKSPQVSDLAGVGDEAFTFKSVGSQKEVRFRYRNVVVVVSDALGTVDDSVVVAKRYVGHLAAQQ